MARPQQRVLEDATDLRALAHPLRMTLLERLTLDGPQTATELAERTGESPANCSWHLRKLAEHGFVEEVPHTEGAPRGRRRPWRATSFGFRWSESEAGEEAQLAGDALTQVMLQRELDRLHALRDRLRDDTPQWRDAADSTQGIVWLTAAELSEINAAVRELVLGHLDRHEDPSRRPADARLCVLVQWGVPMAEEPEP